ncbi:MAG TPA: tripartite tricarboxylate transporter substrate binding protein [Ramlibacter sp.]|uniref:tripartite tricarboxylate transporter substrate binding protein n=1 Tax=Ramlibacter sp. TaxID=1917967 RepID=UPI002ED375CE
MKFLTLLFPFLAAAAVNTAAVAADAWPSKPIRLVVPFTAGGSADALGRIVAKELSQKYGQPVVVENRPGVAGHIGAEGVANSEPDGYTMVLGTTAMHAAYTLYPKLRYHPETSLQPVTIIGEFPNLLVVSNTVQAKSVNELLAYARQNPGAVFFGSAGNGSSTHLAAELFKYLGAVNIKHVPYRGSSAAVNDLMGGQIHMMVENLPTIVPMVQSGRVRALGITSRTRSDALPNVPTIAEAGLKDYEFTAWYTLAVPSKTPKAVVEKLNADINEIVHSKQLAAKWKELGVTPVGGTLKENAAFIAAEQKKFDAFIKAARLEVND